MESPLLLTIRTLLHATRTPFVAARYPEGAVIYRQGDDCDSVMHIESGRVRLAVTARNGKEVICGVLGPGTFLGEEVLAGHPRRRQTAIAMAATEVLVVAKARMVALLHTHPAISDRFLAHVLGRHTHLEADLADQILNSTEQRLVRTLLELAGCDARQGCRCLLPHVSQEIIAEMVGTSRSRVNVLMGKFKRLGFIEENGGVLQVQLSRLHTSGDQVR